MDMFSLSMGSVKSGIDYLDSQGLIEKSHGRGIYIKRKPAAVRKSGAVRLAVFIPPRPELSFAISPTVYMGIQRCVEENNYSLLLNYVGLKEINKDNIHKILGDSQGAIFIGTYDKLLSNISFHIPVVGVCVHESMNGCISTIDIDPFLSAKQAVEYFKRKKCGKVVNVTNYDPAYINRSRVFSALWSEQGGECETVRVPGEIKFDKQVGYLFATCSMLQDYSLKNLEKTGKILSETNIVLGIDGKNRLDPSFHKAASIATDWQNIGRCAFKECMDRINNPGTIPRRLYLPGELYE
jgi:hypothetical protein